MPVDRKALLVDIQKVLREHEVGSARVNLDLFTTENGGGEDEIGDGGQTEQIEIYLEEHTEGVGRNRGGSSSRSHKVGAVSFPPATSAALPSSTLSLPPSSGRGGERVRSPLSKKSEGRGEEGVSLPYPPLKQPQRYSSNPAPTTTSPKKSLSTTTSTPSSSLPFATPSTTETLPPFLQKDVEKLNDVYRAQGLQSAERKLEAEKILPTHELFRMPPSHYQASASAAEESSKKCSSANSPTRMSSSSSSSAGAAVAVAGSSTHQIIATISSPNADPLLPPPKAQTLPRVANSTASENNSHMTSRPLHLSDELHSRRADPTSGIIIDDDHHHHDDVVMKTEKPAPEPEDEGRKEKASSSVVSPNTAENNEANNEKNASEEEVNPHAYLQFSDEVLQMLGLGGSAKKSGSEGEDKELNLMELQRRREERTQVLKSWVGKSTLLDYKKTREKASSKPPRQFLSQTRSTGGRGSQNPSGVETPSALSGKAPPAMGGGGETLLPELRSTVLPPPPPPESTNRSPSRNSPARQHHSTSSNESSGGSRSGNANNCINYRVGSGRVKSTEGDAGGGSSSSPGLTTPKKSLKEMLAEQRTEEAKNKVGLQNHAKIMQECKEYLKEVENDPEKRKLVEVVHNPLTTRKSGSALVSLHPTTPNKTGGEPRATVVERGKNTSPPCGSINAKSSTVNDPSTSGIQIQEISLPDNQEAREVVIAQFLNSPDGRSFLSKSSVKFDVIHVEQAKAQEITKEKEKDYKRLLEAALRYNASLGVKEVKY